MVAVVEGGSIDERLERRAWLALALGDPVELVLPKIKAAHQRPHGTGVGVHRHQRRLCLGDLCQLPLAIIIKTHADNVAAFDDTIDPIGAPTQRIQGQVRARPRHIGQPKRDPLPALGIDLSPIRVGLNHHRWDQVADDIVVIQGGQSGRLVQGLEVKTIGVLTDQGQRRHVELVFGTAPAVASVVVVQATLNGVAGGLLHARIDGGAGDKATGVGAISAHLLDNFKPRHFCNPRRGQLDLGAVVAGVVGLLLGGLGLGLRDVPQPRHAPQYPVSAHQGTGGIGDGVVPRRGFGECCNLSDFGQGQLVDGFTVIHLSGRAHAIRPVAQELFVEIELKNLIFGEDLLDLPRQQNLPKFSGDGVFRR